MATLFDKQASIYAAARPTYPSALYKLLASLSKGHKRAWDVGTGNGQAAVGLADYYDEVIATDVSEQQLQYAERRPNISYRATSPILSQEELERAVGDADCVDVVTVAQAVHWFDLDSFYSHVRRVLRKPGGIIAVWCYSHTGVNADVDAVLAQVYRTTLPFWEPAAQLAFEGYTTLPFPFQPVLPAEQGTGPIRLETKKETTLEGYLGFIKSWSAVNTARARGVELMGEEVQEAFKNAWGDPDQLRTITFAISVRIGSPLPDEDSVAS